MTLTTLIVEDDEGLRPSLVRSFERRGHEVFTATTVKAAVRVLKERRVDLVLLDLRLPDGSGLDVLAEAREVDAEMVVIVMTSFPEVKVAVRAMKEGARDFVTKPFELEELHLTVERAWETRELRRNVHRLERERSSR
ncbi:MAG: response regulator, partial [Chloroflexi bacterium]|nr:response regulator [Chloroflexota bacterium]